MTNVRKWKTGDIIDPEHGTRLDDPDLIAAIIAASRDPIPGCEDLAIHDWSKLTRDEQIELQLGWIEPPWVGPSPDERALLEQLIGPWEGSIHGWKLTPEQQKHMSGLNGLGLVWFNRDSDCWEIPAEGAP